MTIVTLVPVALTRAQKRSWSCGSPTAWKETWTVVPVGVTTESFHPVAGLTEVTDSVVRLCCSTVTVPAEFAAYVAL
jgi:hypothetical protein